MRNRQTNYTALQGTARQYFEPQIEQQQREDVETARYNEELERQNLQRTAQTAKEEQQRKDAALQTAYKQSGRQYFRAADGSLTPTQTDDDWQKSLQQKALTDELNAVTAVSADPSRKPLNDTDRRKAEEEAKKTEATARVQTQAALDTQSKQSTGGFLGFGAKATPEAEQVKRRLEAWQQNPEAPIGESDLAVLQQSEDPASKELADTLVKNRALLSDDEKRRAQQEQDKETEFDLRLRRDNPDAWMQRRRAKFDSLAPEELEKELTASAPSLQERAVALEQTKQQWTRQSQALNDEQARIVADNDAAIAQGVPASQLITDASGKSWTADNFSKLQEVGNRQLQWHTSTMADRDSAQTAEELLKQEMELAEYAQSTLTTKNQAAKLKQREALRATPGMATIADQWDATEKAQQEAVADINQRFEPGTAEHQAAIDSLNAQFQTTGSDLAKTQSSRLRALQEASATIYALEKQAKDESGKLSSWSAFSGDLDYKNPAIEERKKIGITEALKSHGVTIEELGPYLDDAKKLDFASSGADTGTLSNGSLAVNPKLFFDPEAYRAAVEKSDASPEAKSAALDPAVLVRQKDAFVDSNLEWITGDIGYQQWEKNTAKTHKLLEKWTESDKAKAYLEQMDWGAKLGGQLLSAFYQFGLSNAKSAALMAGSFSETARDKGVEWDTASQENMRRDAATGVSDYAYGIPGMVTQAGLSILPAIVGGQATALGRMALVTEGSLPASRAAAMASRWGLAGASGAGALQSYSQVFYDAMRSYKEQGDDDETARQKAIAPALVSGLSTAFVTAAGGTKGVEAIFRNGAINPAFKKTIGSYIKLFAKEGGSEFAEESVDQLIQGIVAKASYDKQKPLEDIVKEAVTAGALGFLLGGAVGGTSAFQEQSRAENVRRANVAAAEAQIDAYTSDSTDPQVLEAQKKRAKTVLQVAQGNFNALPTDALESIGWTRLDGKVVPLKDYQGPSVIEFSDKERTKPVIRQNYIDGITQSMPAVRDAIGMDESEARQKSLEPDPIEGSRNEVTGPPGPAQQSALAIEDQTYYADRQNQAPARANDLGIRLAADEARGQVARLGAEAEIATFAPTKLHPTVATKHQDTAAALLAVASGNEQTLTPSQLNALGLSRNEAGGFEASKSHPFAEITPSGLILTDRAVAFLGNRFPKTRALVHEDMTSKRQQQAAVFSPEPSTPAQTPNPEANTQQDIGSPRGTSPKTGAAPADSGAGNVEGAVEASPAEAAPASTYWRQLKQPERKHVHLISTSLQERGVDKEHADAFAVHHVRAHSITDDDYRIQTSDVIEEIQKLGGGINARATWNKKAFQNLKAWVETSFPKVTVASTAPPASTKETPKAATEESTNSSSSTSYTTSSDILNRADWQESRRNALQTLVQNTDFSERPARLRGATKALEVLDKQLSRYGALFPGGVRFLNNEDASDPSLSGMGSGLVTLYNAGKPSLAIDLPTFLATFSRVTAPDFAQGIQATVEEELTHRVTFTIFKPGEMGDFWQKLPTDLRQTVWQAYFAIPIAQGSVPSDLPSDISTTQSEQMGHEFIRQLIQDDVFRGRVTEAMDADPALGRQIIDFLKRLGEGLRNLIRKADPEIRGQITSYEAQTKKALKALLDTIPKENAQKQTAPPPQQAAVSQDDLLAGQTTVKPPVGVVSSVRTLEGEQGAEGTAYTDQNDAIQYRWIATDISNLNLSNQDDGSINHRFPQYLQPRDRTSASSAAQVQDIASKANFDRLSHSNLVSDGAPIVGGDSVVESGNGRLMGLRRSYARKFPASGRYKEELVRRASEFGLDGVKIQAMESPVLVRERLTPLDEAGRATFAQAANVSVISPMRETEIAKKDASNFTPETLALFAPDENGNLLAASNREFITAFMRDIVPPTERATFIDRSGQLAQSGLRRVRNALFAYAYGSDPAAMGALNNLTESTSDSGKNLVAALTSAAPAFARQKSAMDSGSLHDSLDITSDLMGAVAKWNELNAKGESVATYLAQDHIPGLDSDISDLQKSILGTLADHARSAKRLREILARYQSAVDGAGDPRQGGLFGDEAPKKEMIWKLASDWQPTPLASPEKTLPALPAKTALNIYRKLTTKRKDSALTANEHRVLERAERSLGQMFMFDDSPAFAPTEDGSWTAEQLALFAAPKSFSPTPRLSVDITPKQEQIVLDEQGSTDPRTRTVTLIGDRYFDQRSGPTLHTRNRRRMGQAETLYREPDSRGSAETGEEAATLESTAKNAGIPLIRLPDLGIARDRFGELRSFKPQEMRKLSAGSEAQPFLDRTQGVVYKVLAFDAEGNIGMKAAPRLIDGVWEGGSAPASPMETLHKLNLLSEIGGIPTELVGITPQGDWIVKQPEAMHVPAEYFERAKADALTLAGAVQINHAGLEHLHALWHEDKPWLVGDLHSQNIMVDAQGSPRIMDALISPVPARMIADVPAVATAIDEAKRMADFAVTGRILSSPQKSLFPQEQLDLMGSRNAPTLWDQPTQSKPPGNPPPLFQGGSVDMLGAEELPGLGEQPATRIASTSTTATPRPTKQTTPDKVEAPKQSTEIQDFGEVLPGARKELWGRFGRALSQGLPDDVASITMATHFPEPNYEKLLSDGVPLKDLVTMKAIRDSIPPKPRRAYKLAAWGKLVKTVHGHMQGLVAQEGDRNFYGPASRSRLYDSIAHTPELRDRIRFYEVLGFPTFLKAKDWAVTSSHFNYFNGPRAWTDKTVTYATKDGRMQMQLSVDGSGTEAFEQVSNQVKQLLEQTEAATAAPRVTSFEVYIDRRTEKAFIGKKGLTGVIRIKTGFDTGREAREYLNDNREDLEKIWQEMKAAPVLRRAANRPREGPPMREGDVSPEMFADTFGFRGVQFGNWVENDRRQADLNESFDALLDMAGALGIPPKALSLDGSLGLAFGARGTGGKSPAKAHYEPGLVVINLTKKSGPGSLAHEWFHALDNYFSRLDRKGKTDAAPISTFATDSITSPLHSRPESWKAFQNIGKVLSTGPFASRSLELDETSSKPYYSQTIEKAARAFETYVAERLEGKDVINDYLVNINKEGSTAYPSKQELDDGIRGAYDELFNTLDTKETDRGIALFAASKTLSFMPPKPRALVENLLRGQDLDTAAKNAGVPVERADAIAKQTGRSMAAVAGREGISPEELQVSLGQMAQTLSAPAKTLAPFGWNTLDREASAQIDKAIAAARESKPGQEIEAFVANTFRNTIPGQLAARAIEFTKKQLVPLSVIPREARALLTEMRIKQAFAAERALDLTRALSGKAKFSDLAYPTEFANNPGMKKRLYLAMSGDGDLSDLPQSMQDLAKKFRGMLIETGKAAVRNGRMSMDTFEGLRENYLPHYYADEPTTALGGVFKAFKLGIGDINAQRSTAWHISDRDGKDARTGGPRIVTWDDKGKKWRFKSREHRDAFFEDLIRDETLKKLQTRGGKFRRITRETLDKLETLEPETRGQVKEIMRLQKLRFSKERPLSMDEQEKAGLIMDPVYAIARYMAQMNHDNATAELFNAVAANKAWVTDTPSEGYVLIPDNRRFGRLAGRHVEKNIADQITELAEAPDTALKIYDSILSWWKAGKTVFNPGTHVRNVLGNLMFAQFSGISPWNPGNIKYFRSSLQTLRDGGTFLTEMYEQGVLGGDFSSAELKSTIKSLLPDPAAIEENPGLLAGIGKSVGRHLNNAASKVHALYSLEDEVFKSAAYIKARDMGLSPKEAAEHVRKWFPYYDNLGTSTTIRGLKRTIMPFVSFYRESLRIMATAAKERPLAFTTGLSLPYLLTQMAGAMLGLGDDDLKEIQKDMRGKGKFFLQDTPLFSMLLPFKSPSGQYQMWDLSNVLPFADHLGRKMEDSSPSPWWQYLAKAALSGGPVLNTIYSLANGKDSFGNRNIWEEDMTKAEKAQAAASHVWSILSPPVAPGGTSWNTIAQAGTRTTNKTLEKRDVLQAVARALFGVDFRNANPNLYRVAEDFRKARGLAKDPDFDGGTTGVQRARQRLFAQLAQDAPDIEEVGGILGYLRDEGYPFETDQDLNRLLFYRNPAMIIKGKENQQAFQSSLRGIQRLSMDAAQREFSRIQTKAPSVVQRARALMTPPMR